MIPKTIRGPNSRSFEVDVRLSLDVNMSALQKSTENKMPEGFRTSAWSAEGIVKQLGIGSQLGTFFSVTSISDVDMTAMSVNIAADASRREQGNGKEEDNMLFARQEAINHAGARVRDRRATSLDVSATVSVLDDYQIMRAELPERSAGLQTFMSSSAVKVCMCERRSILEKWRDKGRKQKLCSPHIGHFPFLFIVSVHFLSLVSLR